MSLRVTVTGKVNPLEGGSRSESESEQGAQSVVVDAKLCDLPLVRMKPR
jgi:hypothetical protein